ncbi:hypothetical protein LR48_Vigan09g098700 [Vigna angularis]|uniref:Putative plant transposon protein domain-containing protein n=1 Tax=Phaseolus angularis TaxID=3914 RepID=A0A0L9VBD8_PHAAN|nr:hypothetical protein LR48_Vigan09g098700 [Vigna angularis]
MASSSGSKRIKTTASNTERGQRRKEKVYSDLFLTKDHQKHYSSVHKRKLLMERKVVVMPNDIPRFTNTIRRRNWSALTTYPAPANVEVVKEFYTNAKIFSRNADPFASYVRGRYVPFNADTINDFLNTNWQATDEPTDYETLLGDEIDYEAIEKTLCIPGGTFQRNRQEQPLHIRRSLLTPLSKFWMALMLANISPSSHVSDITTNRAIILYCILTRKSINLGKLIANEITTCAHAPQAKAPLGHPSLITHLCEQAGVDISTPPFEMPRKPIDMAYYTQFCLDEEDVPIQPPQSPRIHHRPQTSTPSSDPYQMTDM